MLLVASSSEQSPAPSRGAVVGAGRAGALGALSLGHFAGGGGGGDPGQAARAQTPLQRAAPRYPGTRSPHKAVLRVTMSQHQSVSGDVTEVSCVQKSHRVVTSPKEPSRTCPVGKTALKSWACVAALHSGNNEEVVPCHTWGQVCGVWPPATCPVLQLLLWWPHLVHGRSQRALVE